MPVGIFFSTLETFLSIDEATVNHHCYSKSTKKCFLLLLIDQLQITILFHTSTVLVNFRLSVLNYGLSD